MLEKKRIKHNRPLYGIEPLPLRRVTGAPHLGKNPLIEALKTIWSTWYTIVVSYIIIIIIIITILLA